jgi:hypothetical protein
MKAVPGETPGSIKLSEEWVREPPKLPRGCDPRGSLAPPKGNALKTKVGELHNHDERGNEVADFHDAAIGYLTRFGEGYFARLAAHLSTLAAILAGSP